MNTPIREPPGADLHHSDQDCNTQINSIRPAIERAIAHLKTWRMLHTDYRWPVETFAETISAVIALRFYRNAL